MPTPRFGFAAFSTLTLVALSAALSASGCGGGSSSHDEPPANRAPTMAAVSVLPGGTEDVPFTISHAALLAASDAFDPDGDPISFRLVTAFGTLEDDLGTPLTAGAVLAPSTNWTWTPPSNLSGTLTAFTVVATDGTHDSAGVVDVRVEVAPVNDSPTLTHVDPLVAKLDQPFSIPFGTLLAAADAVDVDGDALTFRLEAIQGGTLTQGGEAAVAGTATLSDGGTPWVWTGSVLGDVAAFTVTVSDGVDRAAAAQVTIHVAQAMLEADWTGGYAVATPWTDTGFPTSGVRDGMLTYPKGILVHSGYLHVLDSNNARIQRFSASSGVATGWIGKVGTSPTSGADGCAGAALNSVTPGWCLGGTAGGFSGSEGFSSPQALAVEGADLFVVDGATGRLARHDLTTGAYLDSLAGFSGIGAIALDATYVYGVDGANHRIVRVDRSTGALAGWVGQVATLPTSCTSGTLPELHAPTGSWCTGGTSEQGSVSGTFSWPANLSASGGRLYVSARDSSSLQRFDAATGTLDPLPASFPAGRGVIVGGAKLYVATETIVERRDLATGALEGWIGTIGSAPTSCVLGVPSPAAGALTGSWCADGSSTSSNFDPRNGALGAIEGIATDGTKLYVTSFYGHRVQSFDLTTGAPAGWLGARGAPLPAWTTQDLPGPARGTYDGLLDSPRGAVVDGASDELIVASSYRLAKLTASTGAFSGITGQVETMPASCESSLPATVPGPTGGWCVGGMPGYGDWNMGGSVDSPSALALDASYIYYVNGTRVTRFTRGGAFAGWIGPVGSTVGMTPAACAAASVGDFTPDWCYGGFPKMLDNAYFATYFSSSPRGLAVSGQSLYVADSQLNRVAKIDITGGAVRFVGWSGLVSDATGMVCEGGGTATAGAPTPGWCRGGTAAAGTVDGAFTSPYAIAIGPAGTLYVSDNIRLAKLDTSGAVTGWTGSIQGTITGGPCDGASGLTPGWCTGGTPAQNAGTGFGLHYDAAADVIYVANYYRNRVDRFDGSTGGYMGWAGEIATQPTGGGTGCTTAPVGRLTPSWCTGGTAQASDRNGSFTPYAVTGAGDYLYVVDFSRHRVMRLTKVER